MEDYLSSQLAGGERKSGGNFTLSHQAALVKLQAFQVEPAWVGIVKVIQGLIGCGAPEISLQGNLEVSTNLELNLFRDDWASLILASDTPESLRQLWLGLWISLKCCRHIEISYPQGPLMRLSPDGTQPLRSGQPQGRLAIKFVTQESKLVQRLGLLSRHSPVPLTPAPQLLPWSPPLDEPLGLPPLYPLIERAVPLPEGSQPAQGLLWDPRFPPVLAQGREPARMLIRVPARGSNPGQLRVVRAGLGSQPLDVDWALPGAQVWCNDVGLRFDLSGFQVLHDQALEDLKAEVHQQLLAMVAAAVVQEPALRPFKRHWPNTMFQFAGILAVGLLGVPLVDFPEHKCYYAAPPSARHRQALQDLLQEWQSRLQAPWPEPSRE